MHRAHLAREGKEPQIHLVPKLALLRGLDERLIQAFREKTWQQGLEFANALDCPEATYYYNMGMTGASAPLRIMLVTLVSHGCRQ